MFQQIFSAGMGFLQDYKAAKTQAKWDEYNNKMVRLQAAQGQNTITKNVAAGRAQHLDNNILIQRNKLLALAEAKVSAAAAGVSGQSVDGTSFDISRNAGFRIMEENQRFDHELYQANTQRNSLNLQTQMSVKQVTETPSPFNYLAKAGISILNEQANAPSSRGTNLNGAQQTSGGWEAVKNMLMI